MQENMEMNTSTGAGAGCSDAFLLDAASASPRDRFLLMLVERVAALEGALAEHEVGVVEARMAMPEGAHALGGSFAERAAAAAQAAGEAAHAALPGEVAEVALSCSAVDAQMQDTFTGMLGALGPLVPMLRGLGESGGDTWTNLLNGLTGAQEFTVRVTLRGRRALPALERALNPAFTARDLRLLSAWGRAAPGMDGDGGRGKGAGKRTRWVYEAAAGAAQQQPPPPPHAMLGALAALMHAAHAPGTTV